jgi:hypothetical protein
VGLLKSSGTYAQWMTGCEIKTLFTMDNNTDCIQLTFESQLLLGMYQTSRQIKLVRSIFKLSDNCVTVAYRLSDSEQFSELKDLRMFIAIQRKLYGQNESALEAKISVEAKIDPQASAIGRQLCNQVANILMNGFCNFRSFAKMEFYGTD